MTFLCCVKAHPQRHRPYHWLQNLSAKVQFRHDRLVCCRCTQSGCSHGFLAAVLCQRPEIQLRRGAMQARDVAPRTPLLLSGQAGFWKAVAQSVVGASPKGTASAESTAADAWRCVIYALSTWHLTTRSPKF